MIAAAVIGGTSLAGGVGTIYGALIGALVIQSLQSGMVLLGFDFGLSADGRRRRARRRGRPRHVLSPQNRQGVSHGRERPDAARRDEGHLARVWRPEGGRRRFDRPLSRRSRRTSRPQRRRQILSDQNIVRRLPARRGAASISTAKKPRSTTRATPSSTASRRSTRRSRSPTMSTRRRTSISAGSS